jgi:hypothetical protein
MQFRLGKLVPQAGLALALLGFSTGFSAASALAAGPFDAPFGFPGLFDDVFDQVGPGMTRAQMRDASASATQRCTNAITQGTCEQELKYALDRGLVSGPAYDWGLQNGYYPVIDRNDVVQAVCRCGCFAEDTAILAAAGWTPVQDLTAGALVESYAGLESAPEEPLPLAPLPLASVLSGDESQALYVFELANGHTLRLTRHHAVVLADGRIVAAHDVGPDDALMDYATGAPVRILAIGRQPAQGRVFNFEVAASESSGHIVVAEGVLVGDLAWQNQLQGDLGGVLVRR